MIYALKNNSATRGIYKTNEDLFTSSIFERLMYLPSELMQHILETALFDVIPGLDLHKIEDIFYWPNWDPEYTSNKNYVEPDVFIRTLSFDIIIEAKREDDKQQYLGQWIKEIQAYYNEYGEEEKSLIFIALGGLHSEKTESLNVAGRVHNIYKCRWSGILKAVTDIKYKMELSKDLISNNIAICNIIDDLILCFALFGFSTADWLERFMPAVNIKTDSINFLTNSWKN